MRSSKSGRCNKKRPRRRSALLAGSRPRCSVRCAFVSVFVFVHMHLQERVRVRVMRMHLRMQLPICPKYLPVFMKHARLLGLGSRAISRRSARYRPPADPLPSW